MNGRLRIWLKQVAPPMIAQALRHRRRAFGFSGDYDCWASATAAADGYDSNEIFQKTLAAARAARADSSYWDRDGCVFREPAVNWPLLGSLLHVAAASRGELRVVDFGGAFGSTWWQHRRWFQNCTVRWGVVEQPHIARAGRLEFATEELSFFESLEEAWGVVQPTVLLCSGAVQYLDSPHAFLDQVMMHGAPFVILDRTGFLHHRDRDRLTVQWVRPPIYRASYPCWFFARDDLLRRHFGDYHVAAEWQCDECVDIAAEMRGMLLNLATCKHAGK